MTESAAFRDEFSGRARDYAAHRPGYPAQLFSYIADLPAAHDLAWDCATGSGQAARDLPPYFARVVATDASAAQVAHAVPHPSIEYRVAPAEASGLESGSVDLVTVAQALHWLDLERFYAEAKRVLRRTGAIAVWSYGDPVIDDPRADEIVRRFNVETVGAYWPRERDRIGEGYRGLPFPFDEVAAPVLTLEQSWSVPELAGYLRSWSATARYVARYGRDPVDAIERALVEVWGHPTTRRLVSWPLTLRAGRRG